MFIDTESEAARERWAVVHTPRPERKRRFSESCVRLVSSEAEAIAMADAGRNEYPARVYGPSKSSEGLRLYYLIRWLGKPP